MQSIFLPEDIVLLILSYGDVYVTQKMEDVLFQLKYHLDIFDEIRNKSRFFKTYNPCAGYTVEMFYRSMLLNKKKKMIHWIPPSMKYWTLSSSASSERLYDYSISGNSSNTEMYQHTHRTSEYKYDYICDDISTTEMYQLTPYRYEYNCHYISVISQWTSIEYSSEYIPEPEKSPYEFIPDKWRYARVMGEPYKGGKGYGKHGRGKHGRGKHGRGKNVRGEHGRGKHVRGNYSKRGNKKH